MVVQMRSTITLCRIDIDKTDMDLNDYEAVGIWCEQFDVTFGYAPLQEQASP
jgi:hypothetical protein